MLYCAITLRSVPGYNLLVLVCRFSGVSVSVDIMIVCTYPLRVLSTNIVLPMSQSMRDLVRVGLPLSATAPLCWVAVVGGWGGWLVGA